MKFTALPPAGNKIVTSMSQTPSNETLPDFAVHYLDSGTSALALALLVANKHEKIDEPEVLIPGYCCPDLISAALYAGYKPVVVDISVDDPAFNLDALVVSITPKTRAVIAINFLGIREQLEDLQALLHQHPKIMLIEDNAQWFPDETEEQDLLGDMVTFSFGRGKAVSLLKGGMLASKAQLDINSSLIKVRQEDPKWWVKVKMINVLSRPFLFYWVSKLPFLNLGETKFHPLENISTLSKNILARLPINILAARNLDRKIEQYYDKNLQSISSFKALSSPLRRRRLLRYPFLFDSQDKRDRAYFLLVERGLGASKMYNTELSAVKNVAGLNVNFHRVGNAESFASRFITLPVHSSVNMKQAIEVVRIINSVYGQ